MSKQGGGAGCINSVDSCPARRRTGESGETQLAA
jgi:hypothetical protein